MVESANRIIVEMARKLFHAQSLTNHFWAIVVVNVVYTQNRCPTWVEKPIKTWSERRPCIAHMHVCKCVAYSMVLHAQKGKLDAKGTKRENGGKNHIIPQHGKIRVNMSLLHDL